jgi:hypothetical protein
MNLEKVSTMLAVSVDQAHYNMMKYFALFLVLFAFAVAIISTPFGLAQGVKVSVDEGRIVMCANHGAFVAVTQAIIETKLGIGTTANNNEIANNAGNYTVTCILHPEQGTVNTLQPSQSSQSNSNPNVLH